MSEEIQNQEEEQQINSDVLNMSDEDLSNFDPSSYQQAEKEETPEPEETEEVSEQDDDEDQEYEEPEESDDDEEEEPEAQNVYESDDSDEPAETSEHESGVDYKVEYERLLSPFRASKRDISVKSVDDARRLMQMGADYNFKMQALKPQLRIMRALEKNGLLDQNKINFLIDLDKKNPEAIKKFLKDKEIDPIDLDLSEEVDYKPKSYAPSDQEAALDDVLEEIRETPHFQRTIDVLGNQWDAESKQKLMELPQLIRVINDQIGNGIYDQVMAVVENERLMGRLQGLNDLMAYKTVGDALQAQGALKPVGRQSKPQPKVSHDPKLKARKKAASPTKRSPTGQSKSSDFNPLALSDEEFEKLSTPVFA